MGGAEDLPLLAIEAITDDEALGTLCQRVRESFNAHSHFLMAFGGHPISATVESTTHPAEALRAYQEYYYAKDQWAVEAMRRLRPAVYLGQELVPDSVIAKSELFCDFVEEHALDVRHMVGVLEPIAQDRMMVLAVLRSERQEPFSIPDKRLMTKLAPILSATLRARASFNELKLRARIGFSALDAIDRPIIVVDRQAQTHFANRAAEALEGEGKWQVLRKSGRESVTGLCGGPLGEKLKAAVKRVIDGHKPLEALDLEFGSARVSVEITRLPSTADVSGPDGLAMIVLNMAGEFRRPDRMRVSDMLGLSPSETELAVSLAQGEALGSYAERKRISIHTARWTLKQAMAKTGTHRQAELVSLVMRASMVGL